MKYEKLPRRNGGWLYRVRDDHGKVLAAWNGPALHEGEVIEEARKRGIKLRPKPGKIKPLGILPTTLAVGLTCHPPYLQWLRGAMDSIDNQTLAFDQKLLALDSCELPEWLSEYPKWEVVTGDWGSPIPGRNAMLDRCTTTWYQGFDADNVMPSDMAEVYRKEAASVGLDVGFLYPQLQYTDTDLTPTRLFDPPGWSYWKLRNTNFVDNSSLWRVDALKAIGGYQDVGGLDDWVVACRITEQGWIGQRSTVSPVLMREHDDGRRSMVVARSAEKQVAVAKQVRTFGIVTLLAPDRRESQERWVNWLNTADLPRYTSLYVVDNTNSPETFEWLFANLEAARFRSINIQLDNDTPGEGWIGRHQQVARLYRKVLAHVGEDLVVTLEDDVEPPLDGMTLLHEAYTYHSRVGAVAGLYVSPDHPGRACCAADLEEWKDVPKIGDIPEAQVPMPMVGGGFTMYAGWALREAFPIEVLARAKSPLGWDGNLAWRLRRRGWEVLIDGRVRCAHHIHGVVA